MRPLKAIIFNGVSVYKFAHMYLRSSLKLISIIHWVKVAAIILTPPL